MNKGERNRLSERAAARRWRGTRLGARMRERGMQRPHWMKHTSTPCDCWACQTHGRTGLPHRDRKRA